MILDFDSCLIDVIDTAFNGIERVIYHIHIGDVFCVQITSKIQKMLPIKSIKDMGKNYFQLIFYDEEVEKENERALELKLQGKKLENEGRGRRITTVFRKVNVHYGPCDIYHVNYDPKFIYD